jgi:hypothetical protein
MASQQQIQRLTKQVRDDTFEELRTLLPTSAELQEKALETAEVDGIGRRNPQFQQLAMIGALSRIVAKQQRQINALKGAASKS